MKSRLVIRYLIFTLIGSVAAWFNVFAPLHEIWHFWFSSFSGGDPILEWSAVYIERGTTNTIMVLSGFYGEVLLEAGLSLYFLNRGKFRLAGILAGVLISAAIYAPGSSDFAKYEHYIWGLHTSWKIYVVVLIFFTLLVTAITFYNLDTSKIPGKKSQIR